MPKHPCYADTPCFDSCTSKGFYLQQICGHGYLDKHNCPYTIYTECGDEFTNANAVRRLETFGDPICTLLHGCGNTGLSVRVKIPVLLHLCACSCASTEKGYIEDTVPLKLWGCKEDLWRCRILANACVRQRETNGCCSNGSSVSLGVHIEVFMLCGCIMQPSHPCSCPEQKPWYPPLFPCNHR